MRIELIKTNEFIFSKYDELEKLSDNISNIYFWTLPISKNNPNKLPIYIGESSNTKSRFETHLKNLLLGEYWILNEMFAKDYYHFIAKNMTISYETKGELIWSELLDSFPEKIDANYRVNKFEQLLKIENKIKTRIKYLNNITVYVYKIQNIDSGEMISDKNLRKMIEARLILDYSNKILNHPEIIKSNLKTLKNPIRQEKDKRKASSNVTFLGAISLIPKKDMTLEIINFEHLLE